MGLVQSYTLETESRFALWKSDLRMCVLYTLHTGLYTTLPLAFSLIYVFQGSLHISTQGTFSFFSKLHAILLYGRTTGYQTAPTDGPR